MEAPDTDAHRDRPPNGERTTDDRPDRAEKPDQAPDGERAVNPPDRETREH